MALWGILIANLFTIVMAIFGFAAEALSFATGGGGGGGGGTSGIL